MKKMYFFLLLISALISGSAIYLVISRMSPYSDTGWLSVTLFFLSAFIGLSSIFAIIGAVMRILIYKQATCFYHFIISLRQGVLLALFVSGFLAFSIIEVLTWWNIVLLFGAVVLLELYFLNRKVSR